jgi:hypothetical protein
MPCSTGKLPRFCWCCGFAGSAAAATPLPDRDGSAHSHCCRDLSTALKAGLKVVAQHVKPVRVADDELMRLRLMLPIVVATIGLAAPARADDGDQAFLADLDKAGIHYSDPDQAVTAGKTVCSLKDNGMTNDDVVTNLTEQNPGFAQEKAVKFATIATNNYCPQDAGGEAPSSD